MKKLLFVMFILLAGCSNESEYENLYKAKCVQTNESKTEYNLIRKLFETKYKYICDGKEYWTTTNSKQN